MQKHLSLIRSRLQEVRHWPLAKPLIDLQRLKNDLLIPALDRLCQVIENKDACVWAETRSVSS